VSNSRYLIAGGGIAAASAIRGIREIDADGSISVIAAESDPPYRRPWLSKKLWQGKSLKRAFYDLDESGAVFHHGVTAESLEPASRVVVDSQGNRHHYEQLLIATGSTPRRFPFESPGVIYFHDLPDYHHLRDLAKPGARFAVIGGGFIGTEIAAALAEAGATVTLVISHQAVGAALFPPGLADSLNQRYRAAGIDLQFDQRVTSIDTLETGFRVHTLEASTGNDHRFEVDHVVAGIGATPNVALAESAGLRIDNGIVVDQFLRVSDHANIYAAGDVATAWQSTLGTWRRVEHEDNARIMGRTAGRAMAGTAEPYDYLPYFYSDLFELGYEAVGEVDSRLDMVEDWQNPMLEGTVYYLKDDIVRGVLLWNVWDQVPAARELIGKSLPTGIMSRITAQVTGDTH